MIKNNINDEECRLVKIFIKCTGMLEKGCLGEKLKIHSITKNSFIDQFIVTLKSTESDNWFAVIIPIQDDGRLGNVFETVRLQQF
jgi:hypothetical protein